MSKINNNDCNLCPLYFDGRVDDTLCINKTEDGKMHRTTVKEDLISLIQEPNLQFLGYTTPLTGKAVDIANSIIEYTAGNNITLSELVCIGCDGCPTNTGKYNGVIRTLEQRFGRPFQWVICQLHTNELPLRHLIERLDGPTNGPKGFVGPIGCSLAKCHEMQTVTFEPIEFRTDIIDRGDTDQQYLYDICNAISSGTIAIDLQNRSPGKLSHARWLTKATQNIEAIGYVATETPF